MAGHINVLIISLILENIFKYMKYVLNVKCNISGFKESNLR